MKAVRYILANDSNVTSVVAASKIWRNQAQSTQNRPYIIIDTNDVIPSNQIGAASNRDEYNVRVSIFADLLVTNGTTVGCETVAALCRTSLEAYYLGGSADGELVHIMLEDESSTSLKINSQNAHMTEQEYKVILKR